MRISRIKVNNFKSLVDFDLPMEKFTCLIGLNGSGKSTVLQLVDFLGQLMRGRMDDWYEDRRWDRYELRSHQLNSDSVSFDITFADDSGLFLGKWRGAYQVHLNRCDTERLEVGAHWLDVATDSYSMPGERTPHSIPFEYQGSIFSQLTDKVIPEPMRQVRDWIRSIRALDTLSSDFLRLPSEQSAKAGLGLAGRNLAASYERLSKEHRSTATAALRELYPRFMNPVVHYTIPTNSTTLDFVEDYPVVSKNPQERATTAARHVNDGMLRAMAIIVELLYSHEAILFDEIENGINPEIVEKLVDRLVAARQQVFVTTHSPMILNYLDDEVAKRSVVYLYKTDAGHTKAIRFFDIPSMSEKLKVMGPGEVFVDTKLSALADEIAALPKAGAP